MAVTSFSAVSFREGWFTVPTLLKLLLPLEQREILEYGCSSFLCNFCIYARRNTAATSRKAVISQVPSP